MKEICSNELYICSDNIDICSDELGTGTTQYF